MKRKMMLWMLLTILGIWAAGAGIARAEKTSDTSNGKTSTAKSDSGGMDVDWGDDDAKDKDAPATKSDKTSPADKGKDETASEKSKDADKKESASDDSKDDKKDADSDADDKGKTKDADDGDDDADKKGDEEKEVVVLEALEGFYADLARNTEMPEDQQKKLVMIQDAVKKKVDMQAKKDEKELEHLQKKMAKSEDDKEAKKYQKKIDVIEEKSKGIEKAGQQAALKTLKGDQITKWNESLVWSRIAPDMTMLSISEEQRKKAKAVCAEIVAKYKTKPLPEAAGDKLKMTAAKKILKDVLNADKAKEYRRYLSEQMQAAKESTTEEKTGSKKTTKGSREK